MECENKGCFLYNGRLVHGPDCRMFGGVLGQVCQTCGGDGGAVHDYSVGGVLASKFICPHCYHRLEQKYQAALHVLATMPRWKVMDATTIKLVDAYKALKDDYENTCCTKPPPGWWCSRHPAHEGPCAATPYSEKLPPEFSALLKDKG